ncbi:alpha/beta-hydrolase [Peniophora sp. CONT]|nr:alpha/beta-hydrolase [Peniophora sp. CONT]
MSNFSFGSLSQIALAGSIALNSLFSGQQNLSVKSVDLGYAKYQTDVTLAEGVTSFLGIRYAAPPTGNLRFRAPVAPAAVEDLQTATSQPPACWPKDAWTAAAPSEDCLYVNVHVPTETELGQCGAGLPILVFLHGGGYVHGSAAWYPAERLVRDSGHGLIAINVQYRLDAFGFIAGKDVKKDGDLNVGILDQRFALEWVQQHARAFCGDPARVTIFGHSAGAGSVLQHLIAHGGESEQKLFTTAMMSSPFLPQQLDYDDPILEDQYRALVEKADCPVDDGALSCLRSLEAQTLRDVSASLENRPLFRNFVPVVDGSYILERPTLTLGKGNVNAETLMVLTNANEAAIFTPASEVEESVDIYLTKVFPRLPEAQVKEATRLYDDAPNPAGMHQLITQIKSEFFFLCPTYWILDAFSEKTARKGTFAIPPGVHGLDLNYVFKDAGIYHQPVSFPDEAFGQALRHAYLGTAMNGSPTVADIVTPLWPEYSYGGAHTEMLFNKTDDDKIDIHAFQTDVRLQERCDFWYNVAEYTSQ